MIQETENCRVCDGTGWVCENHADRPWDGLSASDESCRCGGAGAPCRVCNYEMELIGIKHKVRINTLREAAEIARGGACFVPLASDVSDETIDMITESIAQAILSQADKGK